MKKTTLYLSLLLISALCAEEIAPPSNHIVVEEDTFDHRVELKTPLEEEQQTKTKTVVSTEQFEVNLKNPVFSQGVISTEEGGVVTAPGIYVQARNIRYTNRIENGMAVQKIEAEGDLMMEYGEHAFVGRKLEYNFLTKTGTLYEGKTYVDIWFLGGEQIQLLDDGSYTIYNAYITTCESLDHTWDIHAKAVRITKEHLLSAKNIRFHFAKIPIFWIPKFKSNLNFLKDSPVRYKLKWDKGLGPRITMRYRFLSWQDFNAYLRLDYRLKKGPGAALETDYHSQDRATIFRTRSYGAYDKSWPNEKTNKRYRFQGLYETKSQDQKTFVHAVYDKLSDEKMPGDFRSDDFEVNTQKRTRLLASHHERDFISSLSFQPRINSFQSINQQLPYITTNIRPFQIGKTGVLFDNFFNAGYLDYVYAGDLHRFITSTNSARLETQNRIYRPIPISYFTLTPNVGFTGIFYSNNQQRHSTGQALLTYGAKASTHLFRTYGHHQHMVEPYATFQGITRPTAGLGQHFVFDMDDGYFQLNLLRLGIKNTVFSTPALAFLPPLTFEIYTNGFFGDRTYRRTFPKAYFNVGWNRSWYELFGEVAWNQEEKVWDYSNVRGAITISEDLAFGAELRHRSRFDWRKADHDNFILDVARSIDQLLHSPLSDQRNTLLFRLYGRIMPGLTFHAQTQHGWGRRTEPRYNEYKIEFYKMIACSWQAKIGYQYTINDPFQITASIQIVK